MLKYIPARKAVHEGGSNMENREDLERLRRLLQVQRADDREDLDARDAADRSISERYEAEERVLRAVESGDEEEAIAAMRAFGDVHPGENFDDADPEGSRLWLTSFNDLMRRRVQMAKVHPSYINRVASYFSRQIQKSETRQQFSDLVVNMLREYCNLVREYSLQDYSQLVRDVVNYIEFHLQEELELQILADRFAVSSGYLSRRFKQETGVTLTEYVNQKRIGRAQALLKVTELPVGEIASAVGIPDSNYFSRLFRKQTGMSPSQYRSAQQA